ncbi:porin [Vibrio sp. HN007]|uniref:porin n=1 Tax=Vibrio iocasae TaxID=3098914 RepID=UPI0035D42E44
MKKSTIALAVLAAAISGTASAYEVVNTDDTKLSVGGFAEARYRSLKGNDDAATPTPDKKSDTSRARINLVGEKKINDTYSSFGKVEIEFKQHDTQTHRAMYAGVKGDMGSISFGRNEPSVGLKNARNLSDIQVEGVEDTRKLPKALKDWAGAQFTYEYATDLFEVAAIYALEDEGETKDNQGKAYAASAKVKTDFGLQVGIGYGAGQRHSDFQNGSWTDNIDESVLYVGTQYKLDQLTLGLTYHDMGKDIDQKGFEAVARYDFDKLSISAGYLHEEEKVSGKTNDLYKSAVISAGYNFTDNFLVHAGIATNSADDASFDRVARIAAKYYF